MDPRLEAALHDMEGTATSFGLRYIKMAEVRTAYVQQIKEMSQSIRASVASGELSAAKGAEMAHGMRNQILDMARRRDFDYGRAPKVADPNPIVHYQKMVFNKAYWYLVPTGVL